MMFGPAPSSAERLGDGSGLALLVIEPSSGALSSANAAATALFALDPQAFGELRAADVLGEFLDLTPRHFATRLETAAGSRPISVRLEALQSGPGSERGALLATVRILPEPSRAARAAELPEPGPPPAGSGRLESLYGLVVRGGVIGSDQISAILAEVARALVAQRATLSRIEDDDVVVVYASDERAVGERVPLARSLERAAFLGSGTFAALDLERDSEYAGAAAGARSFLCSAFRVGEGRWALSVGSAHTREQPFVEDDWRYVETAIEALARSIERRESDERIERLAYSDSLTALPNRVAILT
ncbi:MAG: hypothetical protein ACREQ5_21610, partial [Candidatus Dormibacteria bacterium]